MRRDFLKNLGIEDKDIIDKIMDENSADIGRAKGDLDAYKNNVANLENEIKGYKDEIATLKIQVGETETLNQRISQLEADKTNLTTELNTKVSQIQKGHAIENAIRDAKGKNVKAIRALLDEEKIGYENGELSGITEQLNTLMGAEDSSMLFGETNTSPSGTQPSNPPSNGGTPPTSKTFAEAVAKALSKN